MDKQLIIIRKIVFLLMTVMAIVACNENAGNKKSPGNDGSISGKQLFTINCGQCHKPTENFVGPALHHVADRWKDQQLLFEFIRNPSAVIAKDAYAKALFEQWQRAYMQPFPSLTDEEIKSILAYCNEAQ